jgi:hypothetical protein
MPPRPARIMASASAAPIGPNGVPSAARSDEAIPARLGSRIVRVVAATSPSSPSSPRSSEIW